MAKMNKRVLKQLIKECLVEILAEGLGGTSEETHSLREASVRTQSKKRQPTPRRTALDSISFSPSKSTPTPRQPDLNIPAIAGADSNVMNEIFRDTAQRTLPGMLNAESHTGRNPTASSGDRFAQAVASHDPEDIFEGASNWAAILDKMPENKGPLR